MTLPYFYCYACGIVVGEFSMGIANSRLKQWQQFLLLAGIAILVRLGSYIETVTK